MSVDDRFMSSRPVVRRAVTQCVESLPYLLILRVALRTRMGKMNLSESEREEVVLMKRSRTLAVGQVRRGRLILLLDKRLRAGRS
ncbi:protein of unknown function (plasmid) [Caballeronia sp. S22]